MWSIEDVLRELKEEEGKREKNGGLPPGFRFHPTDEELITFYLASKVFNHPLPLPTTTLTSTSPFVSYLGALDIPEVDLNRCEPWDLPEKGQMGEREWYFYSVRDRKYPTGLRTNRATGSGYWKATGKDRHVYATNTSNSKSIKKKSNCNYNGDHELALIGMKKTLVFYQGRAPRGLKTPWVMHEYRLDGHFSSFRLSSSKEEWVICRIFHKHGGQGGNENKKSRSSPNNYNTFMMGSCLPPLLETPTTCTATATATTSSPPPLPPLPSLLNHLWSPPFLHPTNTAPALPSVMFDDLSHLPQYPDDNLPSLPSIAATTMTMKQEQSWLDKIIPPQYQLPLNPNYYNYDNHQVLSDVGDEKSEDVLHPTNINITGAPDDFPDHAEISASLAAATGALDRLLDIHPSIYEAL